MRKESGNGHMLNQSIQEAWARFWQEDATCWNKIEGVRSRGGKKDAARKNVLGQILEKYHSAQKQLLGIVQHYVPRQEDRDWFVGEIEKAQKRIAFHVAQEVGETYDLPPVRAMLDAPSSRDGPFWSAYRSRESEVCGKLDAEELVNETAGVQAAFKQLTESLAARA